MLILRPKKTAENKAIGLVIVVEFRQRIENHRLWKKKH